MNVMNNSSDEQVECPLCMEPLEVDDLNFYPCTCGYQICRFCWHRIRTDENELCPACRKAYPENPADFTPLSQEQIAAFKAEKRQRDQQRKAKISENRKHLANVRVVQKNLVFVVGLPPRLAEAEILKKHEYFGKYGKIHKVVINPSTTYAGVQGPSASAYVTYVNNNDALRAIQSVNNIMIDNRLIKTSLGTTKYCSHFMKNQTCPKPDCMYLHELGDSEASFTKEEMHQGKHQEYEKRLHDTMLAAQASQPVVQTNGISTGQTIGTTTLVTTTNGIITNGTGGGKTGDTKQISDITNGPIQNKDAWPSLSTSPVNTKENKLNGKTGTNNKENINRNDRKHDKTKMDKSKGGTKVSNGSQKTTNGTHNTNTESHKSKHIKQIHHHITDVDDDDDDDDEEEEEDDDEIDEFEELDNDALSSDNEIKADTPSLSSNNGDSGTVSGKSSPGAFPDPPQISSPSTHEIHTGSQNGHVIANSSMAAVTNNTNNSTNIGNNSNKTEMSINNLEKLTNSVTNLNSGISSSGSSGIGTSESTQSSSSSLFSNAPASQSETTKLPGNLNGIKINANNLTDASSRFSKLSLFDDNNSFFSHNAFQSFYGGLNGTLEHGHTTNSHLPDLLNGTTDSQEHSAKELLKNLGLGISDTNSMPLNTTDDWEAAFKYMMRNNKTVDDHEEYMRMQELQKRNNFINSGLNLPQFNNGFNGDVNLDYFHNSNDLSSRLSHQSQNQQQRLNSLHSNGMGHVYPENMSKFFDFHKNQQQQQQQSQQNQFILNGHSSNIVPPSPADPMNIASLLENSRFNTNFIDQQHTNGLLGSQMQKQRLLNNQMNTHNLLLNNNQQQQPQQNNRLLNSQFTQNQNIDDDLGFDPFFETQKGLAELLNDEILQHQQQQQQTSKILENVQRTRMPPPGFNHMNAFGFGVPRAQVNDISGSKILPFMNLGNNTQPQQQQQPPQTNWGQQQQQQQQHMGYPQNEQSHAQQQNNLNKSGFGNNFNTFTDWTSFDPAIVSFRQFPSFINGQSVNGQPNGNDIFMSQQLNQQNLPQQQQQQQQPGQGFGHHGINLQSSIMNQQQSNQQAQVNFSHSNWLNTDQNIYMNNLSNGFTNNFEKFTIPMPPGFQSNVTGTSKQKAECIN